VFHREARELGYALEEAVEKRFFEEKREGGGEFFSSVQWVCKNWYRFSIGIGMERLEGKNDPRTFVFFNKKRRLDWGGFQTTILGRDVQWPPPLQPTLLQSPILSFVKNLLRYSRLCVDSLGMFCIAGSSVLESRTHTFLVFPSP